MILNLGLPSPDMKRPPESDFSQAFRLVRKAKGLTQEDFDGISSRVYVSALERGIKQPTLPKVDAFADHLGVHPLTLLALAYCRKPRQREDHEQYKLAVQEVARHLLQSVEAEIDALSFDS